MGLFDRLRRSKNAVKATPVGNYKLMAQATNGAVVYDGKVYDSDILRAAIRPKVRTIGKMTLKHTRKTRDGDESNEQDLYMQLLLREPNAFMSMQQLLEKLVSQLEVNNNAFAVIVRDGYGLPEQILPVNAVSVEVVLDERGNMYYKFNTLAGKAFTFSIEDVIHLRKDVMDNDLIGKSNAKSLLPLMEVVYSSDRSIVNAVKNSGIIRWLLKFHGSIRPDDIKRQTKEFAESFLQVDDMGENVGVAGVDSKSDAVQIQPHDFVPDPKNMDGTVKRLYSYFNTNEKIVMSTYNENEFNSWYETNVEPDLMQIANEFTRKLFTRRQRAFGNRIEFDALNLTYASLQTKLGLVQLVDRGILSRNEVRGVLNLSSIEGGDEYLLRLDTGVIKEDGSRDQQDESEDEQGGGLDDENIEDTRRDRTTR